jgi:hypothetical protein
VFVFLFFLLLFPSYLLLFNSLHSSAPQTAAPAQSGGPSMLGTFASSMAGSVAGSVIGHSVAGMMQGGSSAENVAQSTEQVSHNSIIFKN